MRDTDRYRTIARSALVSTHSIRRQRQYVHRRHRRVVREALHQEALSGDPDTPLFGDTRDEIARLVEDRRWSDKLAPLGRWAVHELRGRTLDDDADVVAEVVRLRSKLPNDLAGRHAAGHLEWIIERRKWSRTT